MNLEIKLLICLFVLLSIFLGGCGKAVHYRPSENPLPENRLTKVMVDAGQCVEIASGVYAENIKNGKVFDVYYNPSCKDNQGEYCNNVVPVNQDTERVEPYEGSGTICLADNLMISGVKIGSSIEVRVLDFN